MCLEIYRERHGRMHTQLKMVNTSEKGDEIAVFAKRILTFSVIF